MIHNLTWNKFMLWVKLYKLPGYRKLEACVHICLGHPVIYKWYFENQTLWVTQPNCYVADTTFVSRDTPCGIQIKEK